MHGTQGSALKCSPSPPLRESSCAAAVVPVPLARYSQRLRFIIHRFSSCDPSNPPCRLTSAVGCISQSRAIKESIMQSCTPEIQAFHLICQISRTCVLKNFSTHVQPPPQDHNHRKLMDTRGTSRSSPSSSSHATTTSKWLRHSGISIFATVTTSSDIFLSMRSLCLGKRLL